MRIWRDTTARSRDNFIRLSWTRAIWREVIAHSSVSGELRVRMESFSMRAKHSFEERSKRVWVLSKLARFFTATSDCWLPSASGVRAAMFPQAKRRACPALRRIMHGFCYRDIYITKHLYHNWRATQADQADSDRTGSGAVCGRSC